MNDQYLHLGGNGAALHQSIVHNKAVAEKNIHVALFDTFSDLQANELLKEEPNHYSNIKTARLNEKIVILQKKACSQFHPKKVGLPAKKYFFYPWD